LVGRGSMEYLKEEFEGFGVMVGWMIVLI
jgi:hypothetical protein